MNHFEKKAKEFYVPAPFFSFQYLQISQRMWIALLGLLNGAIALYFKWYFASIFNSSIKYLTYWDLLITAIGSLITIVEHVQGRNQDQWTSYLTYLIIMSGLYPFAPLVCVSHQTAALASPGQIIEAPETMWEMILDHMQHTAPILLCVLNLLLNPHVAS